MRLLIMLSLALLVLPAVLAQDYPAQRVDATLFWFSNLTELPSGEHQLTVHVKTADRDNNTDWDGGRIVLENARIAGVERINWERDCNNEGSRYECVLAGIDALQWFNFVANEEDYFTFNIRYGNRAFMTVVETGGMECGAYLNTAQAGPFRGFADGSGGIPCSEQKTWVSGEQVAQLGGFPLRIRIRDVDLISKPPAFFAGKSAQPGIIYALLTGILIAAAAAWFIKRR